MTSSASPPLHHSAPLLEVTGLVKRFAARGWRRRQGVHALNGVSLSVAAGETLGVVGESGSGKSTLGRIIVRLLPADGGSVRFEGTEVLTLRGPALRALRQKLQVIFQDPYGSLNPRMRVGQAVREGLEIHRVVPRDRREERVRELFAEVGLDPSYLGRYPHQLSGGQRQRVGIARALAVGPRLLICDEPVSALDVSVQAQVLNLLKRLQRRRGLSYLFIAHDLAVVRQLAHRIAVMYFGRIVEEAATGALIGNPRHPYTQALLSAVPSPDPEEPASRIVLTGEPPKATAPPPGCPFYSRCFHPLKDARCTTELPLLRPVETSLVACHYAEVRGER